MHSQITWLLFGALIVFCLLMAISNSAIRGIVIGQCAYRHYRLLKDSPPASSLHVEIKVFGLNSGDWCIEWNLSGGLHHQLLRFIEYKQGVDVWNPVILKVEGAKSLAETFGSVNDLREWYEKELAKADLCHEKKG